MCFLHVGFCYGGGYFWVRGLGAARWVNTPLKTFRQARAFSPQPLSDICFFVLHIYLFLVPLYN